jgi:hypothetical protein
MFKDGISFFVEDHNLVILASVSYMVPLAWIIHDLSGEKRKDALKG